MPPRNSEDPLFPSAEEIAAVEAEAARVASEQAEAERVAAEQAAEAEAAAAAQAELDAANAAAEAEATAEPEPLPTHIPMSHPDNGRCDRYEADEAGVHLVPVEDVALMLEHGFVPAEGPANEV